MSGQIDDGGPAHPGQWVDFQPTTGDQVVREQWAGMSLRDWFAGQASEADIDQHRDYQICPETSIVTLCRTREAAKYAYADAMIAARKGGAK